MSEMQIKHDVLVTSALPKRGGYSLVVDDGKSVLISRSDDLRLDLDRVGSFWNRRRPAYFEMPDELHRADELFVSGSSSDFVKSIMSFSEGRFSVNPLSGILATSDKFRQLLVARDVGFRVPATAITNDFDELNRFRAKYGEVCIKTYRMAGWRTVDGHASSFTALIRRGDKIEREAVESAPSIYQEVIEKAYEVRLTVFGGYHCGTRISSQEDVETSLDWRQSPSYLKRLSSEPVPDYVVSKARAVLSGLGIRFGTFDLAVTRSGEWVFFEVNESGQFIWQEQYCPDCILLQPFCEYLSRQDDRYTFDAARRSEELSYASIWQKHRSSAIARHVFGFPQPPDIAFGVVDEREPQS